jgi:hypothetical protein
LRQEIQDRVQMRPEGWSETPPPQRRPHRAKQFDPLVAKRLLRDFKLFRKPVTYGVQDFALGKSNHEYRSRWPWTCMVSPATAAVGRGGNRMVAGRTNLADADNGRRRQP